jgi:hypothetical protein
MKSKPKPGNNAGFRGSLHKSYALSSGNFSKYKMTPGIQPDDKYQKAPGQYFTCFNFVSYNFLNFCRLSGKAGMLAGILDF